MSDVHREVRREMRCAGCGVTIDAFREGRAMCEDCRADRRKGAKRVHYNTHRERILQQKRHPARRKTVGA